MRKIVVPGFHTSSPIVNNEITGKREEPQISPKKTKVKKSELKELVSAIIKEKVPKKPKTKKPKVDEGTVESRLQQFKNMQQNDITSWFQARHLSYSEISSYVLGSNGQVLGSCVKESNGSMTVRLDKSCFPDTHVQPEWRLGEPSKIKKLKQDRTLTQFCGDGLRWEFDCIISGGDIIGSILRFSDGSLQINIIYGDPARHGEYKFDCFKGIGD